MDDQFEKLQIRIVDGVSTVTVDRPESRNSLDIATLKELAAAIEQAMSDGDVGVVVLTGAGEGAFVSGADIGDFHGQSATWFKRDFRRAFGNVEDAIEEGPKPVIAAVNGVAFGGGLELMMMCDLVYAAESAKLGVPEANLGGIPGVGGTQRLALLVGYLKAKEMVLTGDPVSATEAADIGLVNDVFPDRELYESVYEIADDLVEGAPYAQWFGKQVINETRVGLGKGLELEAALGAVLFETDDIHEGFEAFLERRDPDFSDWSDF